ncbi:hypothetical protein PVK06_004849 [Gossypium arboreum]|uniref:Uncharacterized protein n=1 Tax=Gossypium arboreum TaxID=29729 RepID=A0ABR0QT26_GOSAR|nr:hypothetical protein PVK06_004849 [Gossypium arboreum]
MVKGLIDLLQKRLDVVEKEPIAPGQDFISHLAQREKEIQNLKEQMKTLQETGQELMKYFWKLKEEKLKTKKKKATEETKAVQKEEEIKLGKRPIVDNSPPKSPSPKQASRSLMIQQNQNPFTKFLKDYKESVILKISAL